MANIGPTENDVAIGQLIKIRRRQLKLSQSVLGENLGITFQQIQKYERGTNRIGSGRLAQVAQLLDVPIEYFYSQFERRRTTSNGGAELDLRMLRAFANIEDHEQRHALVVIAEKMAVSKTKNRDKNVQSS